MHARQEWAAAQSGKGAITTPRRQCAHSMQELTRGANPMGGSIIVYIIHQGRPTLRARADGTRRSSQNKSRLLKLALSLALFFAHVGRVDGKRADRDALARLNLGGVQL
jgi:hypothetical protein